MRIEQETSRWTAAKQSVDSVGVPAYLGQAKYFGSCAQLGEGAMSEPPSHAVSALLAKWRAGDDDALRSLVPLVYDELRQLAHRYLQREKPDHTLQSTALVHEAYLRLAKQDGGKFQNRPHFVAICAQLMRQVLIEYARNRRAAKRDGGCRLSLSDPLALAAIGRVDLLSLDDALKGLALLDPEQSRIVELRFFGGLSIEESSEVLGISPATVKRHWTTARVWLRREIGRSARA
jgi:RNA polymerase sigma factor (TIGR02999 family)